ncbi:hypothetical protein [Rhodococcus tukisamuensis]|nr:hypothetical protein [Rhodococcus tukisamuensis]
MNEDPMLLDAAVHPDPPHPPAPRHHKAPMLIAAFAVGLLAAAGIVAAAMIWMPAPERATVAVSPVVAAPPSTVYITVPAAPLPPAPPAEPPAPAVDAQPAPALAAPTVDGTDAQGFLGSAAASCRSGHPAVAVVRTEKSRAVICEADDGGRYYRALRLRDGAPLEVGGAAAAGDGFVARTGSYAYFVSPNGLTVSRWGNALSQEPAIEYWSR